MENEATTTLIDAGFGVISDNGNAVIVCGPADRIPLDRPKGALDFIATTIARRFDSAAHAVDILIGRDKKHGQ